MADSDLQNSVRDSTGSTQISSYKQVSNIIYINNIFMCKQKLLSGGRFI